MWYCIPMTRCIPCVVVAEDDDFAEGALGDGAHDLDVFVGKVADKDRHIWTQSIQCSSVEGVGVLVVHVANNSDAHCRCHRGA